MKCIYCLSYCRHTFPVLILVTYVAKLEQPYSMFELACLVRQGSYPSLPALFPKTTKRREPNQVSKPGK